MGYIKLDKEYFVKKHESEKKKALRIIPILLKVVKDGHVVVPVKSEKISKTQSNYMYDVLKHIKVFFDNYSGFEGDVDAKSNYGGGVMSFRERSECIFGFSVEDVLKIYETLNLKNGWSHQSVSVDYANSYQDSDAYDVYGFNGGKYSICWKPESVTPSPKRTAEDLYKNLLVELMNKMGVMTNSCLPAGTYYTRNRNKITENEIREKIKNIQKYLNDKNFVSKPCSTKQAKYVAKFLNVSVTDAERLNSWQAREILDVYFDDYYTANDDVVKEMIEFYLRKLK